MSVPEDLAKSGYAVYQKTTEGIPWWAKALIIGGATAGAIYGAYYIINKFVNPSPVPPPNLQQLISMKQQSYQNWLQTYDNFTQHGTKALTQDQINTLNTIQDQISYYNSQIEKEYKDQLEAQEALHSGIENAAIEGVAIIVAGAVGYGLSKYALQQWFKKPKPPPGGGSNTSPDDVLTQTINTAFTKTPKGQENNSAQALTATELAIGVELLSYGYQLAGYTSNAINILNAYIPIATAHYNSITNAMALVSNLYASGQLTQTEFVNMQLTLNVSLVATYALLVYYSIEGFTITVSSWVINAVNTIAANALITAIAAIGILTAFAIYYFGPEIAEIVGQLITKVPA
jgi:hypothetical protein